MTNEEIGRAFVACKRWRWMPGMRWLMLGAHGRMIGDNPSGGLLTDGIPDVTDPATLGCILALVREAGPKRHVLTCYSVTLGGWYVFAIDPETGDWQRGPDVCPTEAEALLRALESAP